MRFTSLQDWLAWQETLHVSEIELGLDRCRSVAERMGLKQPSYGFVSVSGTNGKGSSVAMLSTIARKAGYKTGVYTSPHLVHYNERIRIDGEMLADELLCEAFDVIDRARGETSLTYFEFGTLAAYYLFDKLNVDFAVFEVGLGGRLDAVNLMDASAALVTSIDLDHTEWLGDTRDAIGYEKAGIMRSGHPAVCSDPDAPQRLVEHAQTIGAPLALLGQDFHYEIEDQNWTWWDEQVRYENLPRPKLRGDFQLMNAAGVLKIIRSLSDRYTITETHIREGLESVELSGRFQVVPGDVELVLDVAHNPHAAKALSAFLRHNPIKGKNRVLIAMLKDKDSSGVIDEISPYVDEWHVASLGGMRGGSSDRLVNQLAAQCPEATVTPYETVEVAYRHLQAVARAGDRILVAGSFHTVSAVLKLLDAEP